MRKFIIAVASIVLSSAITVQAASSFEVEQYNKYAKFSDSAMQLKDYEQAYEHLLKSSELGNKISQYNLATLYIEGLGVKQDYAQAYLWLSVAAEANEKKWRDARDQLHNAFSEEHHAMLAPHVKSYIDNYGAEAQEITCSKRASTGSNRRVMQCAKNLTEGL